MANDGPFRSLTDTDKQVLVDRIYNGASVSHAVGELGLHYRHALNYARTLGLGNVEHHGKR